MLKVVRQNLNTISSMISYLHLLQKVLYPLLRKTLHCLSKHKILNIRVTYEMLLLGIFTSNIA